MALPVPPLLLLLASVVAACVIAYAFLIVLLRISGNRTLSKLRAFDFIVTIAIGSLVAQTVSEGLVTMTPGLTAIASLVVLQAGVAWLSTRSKRVNALVTTPPRLLLKDGLFLDDALRSARVTRDEVLMAVRAQGLTDARSAWAVILESNGELVVIPEAPEGGSASAMGTVRGA